MYKIAVMGHGTVGSGVVEVFSRNHDGIIEKAGADMDIKYILDLREFPELPYADKFIKDFDIILNDPEIIVVVEVMGGLNPAYDYVKRCLLAGKSVVTSNKELVAAKGGELLKTARDKNVNFLFEASVGGGIPIIRPISQCLAANDLIEIIGILNGTTNFILTKMFKEGMSFEAALSMAQKLGYAERDPSADIDAHDSCRKICILASLAFGRHVYPAQVQTEGIRRITGIDVAYADACGCVIKLIGQTKKVDDEHIQCLVAPMFVSKNSQLSTVDDVFNAIMVRGNATGDVMFYGRGAGKMPTASAVVADVIDCIKHVKARKYLYWDEGRPDYVTDQDEAVSRFFIRAKAADLESTEKLVKKLFGNVTFVRAESAPPHELAFITLPEKEGITKEKLKSASLHIEPIAMLRMCD
mgnify:FL=1